VLKWPLWFFEYRTISKEREKNPEIFGKR
jgi:hypothetical protein